MDLTSEVIKRGQTCIQVILHRTRLGLTVEVHSHPNVEDFFRTFTPNPPIDVMTIGRYWLPYCQTCGQHHQTLNTDIIGCRMYIPKPLMAYAGVVGIDPMTIEDNTVITLDNLGQPLIKDGRVEGGNTLINISFLRLVGISEGGVTFGVRGVYSTERLHRLRDVISTATRKFYIDYLRPVDMSVVISTQELRL